MPTPKINRTPPVAVRRALRHEVGFGCPVDGCGTPYLEYHHFDPQWHVENHHRPEGMIALCATHHAKADAWTIEQCRELKGSAPHHSVSGRFEWMRHEIVAIVGGNYYHETPSMLVFHGKRVAWFDRDPRGYLLLSLRMLTISDQPRARLDANDWEVIGNPSDVSSPPNGSSLDVRYDNGDRFTINFTQWEAMGDLKKFHPRLLALADYLKFPLTTAEITMNVGGTEISLSSKGSRLGGFFATGNVVSKSEIGFAIG